MKLFVSHASEDKSDFVRPLAERLREIYEVWFDEYELTLGDSLLAKIDEGLRSSDFGIVVLSPHFFAKKWPRRELDGLSALETTNRKLILPIWKDVGETEVAEFSPTLAGRLAVKASEGLDEVVKQIRIAVEASERKRQLTALTAASQRLLGVDETFTEERDSTRMLMSEKGVTLVAEGVTSLFRFLTAEVDTLNEKSNVLKFNVRGNDRDTLGVETLFGLSLHLQLRNLAINSAASARLTLAVFRQKDKWGQELEVLTKNEFAPLFHSGAVLVWKSTADNKVYSNEELAALAIEMLRDEIDRFGKDFRWS
jgi:hypothetical protein